MNFAQRVADLYKRCETALDLFFQRRKALLRSARAAASMRRDGRCPDMRGPSLLRMFFGSGRA
jgi:hypothetical protein